MIMPIMVLLSTFEARATILQIICRKMAIGTLSTIIFVLLHCLNRTVTDRIPLASCTRLRICISILYDCKIICIGYISSWK